MKKIDFLSCCPKCGANWKSKGDDVMAIDKRRRCYSYSCRKKYNGKKYGKVCPHCKQKQEIDPRRFFNW